MNKFNNDNKRISIADFQHPADKAAIDAVLTLPIFEKVMEFVSKNSVEKFFALYNDSSYLKLTRKMSPKIFDMIDEAKEMFGSNADFSVYMYRDYNITLVTNGMKNKHMIFTTSLLEKVSDDVLWAIVCQGVASFEAKHSSIKLIQELLSYGNGLIPLALDQGLDLAIKNWNRNREYTMDRALLLATGDFNKTMRYILLGEASEETLANIDFISPDNSFLEQAKEYLDTTDKVGNTYKKLSIINSSGHSYASRYLELYNWYIGGEYQEVLERSISNEL